MAHHPAPQTTLLDRWLPHPLLTLGLTVTWLLLANSFSVGAVLLGLILGVTIARMTASFWPDRPHITAHGKLAAYVLLVLWDIVIANLQVARLILFVPLSRMHTRFVVIPLTLRSPEGITLFAGTITMTPGTVSCDLSADGRSLLVHCLDAPDAHASVAGMKERYERRLLEIFE